MAIHDAPKDILSGTCSFQKVELKYGIHIWTRSLSYVHFWYYYYFFPTNYYSFVFVVSVNMPYVSCIVNSNSQKIFCNHYWTLSGNCRHRPLFTSWTGRIMRMGGAAHRDSIGKVTFGSVSGWNTRSLSSSLVGDITLCFLSCPKYTIPTLVLHVSLY